MGTRRKRPDEYAYQAAEAIWSLNESTREAAGYREAYEVDAVIGHLSTAVDGMTQTLSQIQRWLYAQEKAGRLGHNEDGDTAAAVEALSGAILRAAARIEALDNGLNDMRRVSAHLKTITPDQGTERRA